MIALCGWDTVLPICNRTAATLTINSIGVKPAFHTLSQAPILALSTLPSLHSNHLTTSARSNVESAAEEAAAEPRYERDRNAR